MNIQISLIYEFYHLRNIGKRSIQICSSGWLTLYILVNTCTSSVFTFQVFLKYTLDNEHVKIYIESMCVLVQIHLQTSIRQPEVLSGRVVFIRLIPGEMINNKYMAISQKMKTLLPTNKL